MPNPLFSRYSQGENRVTASILAVFERISFSSLERILQIVCEEPNESLLEIKNQIKPTGFNAVPDGAIQASFAYWIETKVKAGTVCKDQIERHLKALDSHPNASKKKLIVLTPDNKQPQVITDLKSPWTVWVNFNTLTAAISEVLSTEENWITGDFPLLSEQEKFLLRELVQMFLVEGLLENKITDSVLIVPARHAIHEYEQYSVYLCQPNRPFQKVNHLGFYRNRAIDKRITKILCPPINEIELTEAGVNDFQTLEDPDVKNKLSRLLECLKVGQNRHYGEKVKVFFLSAPDSPETIQLQHDIQNNLVNSSGTAYPFTYGQRYVSLAALKRNPVTTSELLK